MRNRREAQEEPKGNPVPKPLRSRTNPHRTAGEPQDSRHAKPGESREELVRKSREPQGGRISGTAPRLSPVLCPALACPG